MCLHETYSTDCPLIQEAVILARKTRKRTTFLIVSDDENRLSGAGQQGEVTNYN